MDDQAIEQEIVAKGKTAPRVTPTDIEANIASEHYFTAEQGARMVTIEQTGEWAHPQPPALFLLTFCVLVLQNGFTVTGESACASPENFDAEIGRNVARQNAVQKIWPLMGYALKQRLHNAQLELQAPFDGAPEVQPPAGAAHSGYSAMQPHQQRVVDEQAELDDRAAKLNTFINTTRFADLDEAERHRMRTQYVAMKTYSDILGERIAAFK